MTRPGPSRTATPLARLNGSRWISPAGTSWATARWQEAGPVYADSPLTPDYIALDENPYEGWQESGCSLLGADRRADRRAAGDHSQRLYATWDQAALRLAWTGTTWSGDGDLFVYLDTGPDGTSSLYNPAGATEGGLALSNSAMGADVLVWVQDAHTATLLRWDGGAWTPAATLSAQQFRFDPGREGGQTDLYLPFDLIGFSAGSSLGLVAVAAEEPVTGQELRLWAALPQFNPVDSPRVNRMLGFVPPGAALTLSHAYRWDAAGDGVCPNGSNGSEPGARFGDVYGQLSIQSDPPGVGLSGLGRGLFWVSESAVGSASGLAEPGMAFASSGQAPVAAGQTIVYTVHYRNAGSEAQHGVRLLLGGDGVDGLPESVALGEDGEVPPGGDVQATFQGTVTGAGPNAAWASVKGLLYDSTHPAGAPLDWLWVTHQVDRAAPDGVRILRPATTIGPGRAIIAGVAHDASGVSSVEVEINGQPALTCPVARPAGGLWRCAWDVGDAEDGMQFTLRARATDVLGQTSDWSDSRTVTVDARPPELKVDSLAAGSVVRDPGLVIGSAGDDSGLALVRVCVDGKCGRASRLAAGGAAARWIY